MRQMYTFVLGAGVGAALCLGAMNFHVVRAQDGWHLVQKHHARLGQVYVDTRQFGASDWINNTDLAAALTADNKAYVMQSAVTSPLQNGLNRLAGRPKLVQ
jgi:hypothetical protein